ncbi:MAG: hypothetical protein DMF99_28055 [Acidobacteria bacterium]|nr:MAG: hypothetical protein DMF99_28055 [Acidobacteriota bacterium]
MTTYVVLAPVRLGQAQPVLNQMRSDNLLERLKRAAQCDDELQRRGAVGISGGCRLAVGSRHQNS